MNIERAKKVGIVKKHTGQFKDMAIIEWTGEQPPEGSFIYIINFGTEQEPLYFLPPYTTMIDDQGNQVPRNRRSSE